MGLLVAILLALQKDPAEEAVRKGLPPLMARAADAGDRKDLVLCTLIELGVRETDPVVAALLQDLLAKPPETTRSVSLQARALLLLHRDADRDRLGHFAQFLVDNQSADGGWGRGAPVDPPELRPEPPAPTEARTANHVFGVSSRRLYKISLRRKDPVVATGDVANSFLALEGLSSCAGAGMILPPEALEKALQYWRTVDVDPARRVAALGGCLSLLRRDYKQDADLVKAAEQLATQTLPTDPGSLLHLKQAMWTWGQDRWTEGAKLLTDTQDADGGWGSLDSTCAALRYLHVPRLTGIPEDPRRRNGMK